MSELNCIDINSMDNIEKLSKYIQHINIDEIIALGDVALLKKTFGIYEKLISLLINDKQNTQRLLQNIIENTQLQLENDSVKEENLFYGKSLYQCCCGKIFKANGFLKKHFQRRHLDTLNYFVHHQSTNNTLPYHNVNKELVSNIIQEFEGSKESSRITSDIEKIQSPNRNEVTNFDSSMDESESIHDENNRGVGKNLDIKQILNPEITRNYSVEESTQSELSDTSTSSGGETMLEEDHHKLRIKHDENKSENDLENEYQIIKDEIQQQLNNELKEFGVDPTWEKIPKTSFHKIMRVLNHNEQMATKGNKEFELIKRNFSLIQIRDSGKVNNIQR